jgi:hypothetical protein
MLLQTLDYDLEFQRGHFNLRSGPVNPLTTALSATETAEESMTKHVKAINSATASLILKSMKRIQGGKCRKGRN